MNRAWGSSPSGSRRAWMLVPQMMADLRMPVAAEEFGILDALDAAGIAAMAPRRRRVSLWPPARATAARR
ncbi:hypothetical protein ACU4GD_42920 [Cupriavidus basilensis]